MENEAHRPPVLALQASAALGSEVPCSSSREGFGACRWQSSCVPGGAHLRSFRLRCCSASSAASWSWHSASASASRALHSASAAASAASCAVALDKPSSAEEGRAYAPGAQVRKAQHATEQHMLAVLMPRRALLVLRDHRSTWCENHWHLRSYNLCAASDSMQYECFTCLAEWHAVLLALGLA